MCICTYTIIKFFEFGVAVFDEVDHSLKACANCSSQDLAVLWMFAC